MKVKILAALKTKFTGVQDAILNRVADKLLSGGKVTKEEDIATAVDGVTFQQVLEMYGDSRANEASATAVRNYENTHHLKDGKPTEGAGAGATPPADKTSNRPAATAGEGGGEEKVPAWAQQLIDGLKSTNDRLTAFEKGRTTESRRSQLDAVISKLPESLRKAYSRTPVESQTDEEFASLLADVTNEVAAIETDTRAQGAVIGRPLGAGRTSAAGVGAGSGAGNGEATDAEVDAVVAKLNI